MKAELWNLMLYDWSINMGVDVRKEMPSIKFKISQFTGRY